MIVKCEACQAEYDDEFRDTGCPHGTFLANNGRNEFAEHQKAYLSTDKSTQRPYKAPLFLTGVITDAYESGWRPNGFGGEPLK